MVIRDCLTAAGLALGLCALPPTSAAPGAFRPLIAAPAVAIDFSHAGYAAGLAPLPHVSTVLKVSPSGGDDTALLQEAVRRVAAMPADGPAGVARSRLIAGPSSCPASCALTPAASSCAALSRAPLAGRPLGCWPRASRAAP